MIIKHSLYSTGFMTQTKSFRQSNCNKSKDIPNQFRRNLILCLPFNPLGGRFTRKENKPHEARAPKFYDYTHKGTRYLFYLT